MKFQPSTHLLILGATVGLIIGVGLIIYMISNFSMPQLSVDVGIEGATTTELIVVEDEYAPESLDEILDWEKDEVIVRSTSTKDSPYSIDDLNHLDLGLRPPKQPVTLDYEPVAPVYVAPSSTPEDNSEPQYEKLDDVSWKDCGSLKVPSGFGLAMFALTAPTEPAVICLGETIANSCGSSYANVSLDAYSSFKLFVNERPDGVCGVGINVSAKLISLCSVEKVLDLGSGTDKTFKEWQSDFKLDPGSSFATMYFNNTSVFTDPSAVIKYDCRIYEI